MSGGKPLTYAGAGVDIEAGNEAVRRIKALVETTRRPEQLDGLGGFAGLMGLPAGLREPVLVSCTDGVGTKLLVAIALDRHDSVGIDLVAMNVNDLLCTGAQPLFLLDYIATGRLEPGKIEQLVAGVVAGCRQAGCALLGGETAELPGMYADGHYDLAATAVGVVERDEIWGPHRAEAGDAVLALPSSGLHSNGYSLARKALLSPEHGGLDLGDPLPGAGPDDPRSVGDALLEPTRIYEPAFAALRALDGAPVHAAAHITGGGLIENPPRALRDELAMEIDLSAVAQPAVLRAVAACGVARDELLRTFNCGIGMLLLVDPARADDALAACDAAGQPATPVGRVVPRSPGAAGVHINGLD
ncbi:Phosphoribosylformylglycinamidine cyclo-ligase [Enhygromyxa salina]|uniref:Phosphoribosylformylglycinamidine cyclo-ligase n=1 Tax=Enhygromyxa salina TaxID=215803 RepID=A0A2S9XH08_9BACT|nr:phosphoribosylformylglycinamidine cyclo-ligase [Enhygromyxa salina]PRP91971.1 Phosphoribosylformylglycinamidine cyclo-ligase [Enhygromyxa salina]